MLHLQNGNTTGVAGNNESNQQHNDKNTDGEGCFINERSSGGLRELLR